MVGSDNCNVWKFKEGIYDYELSTNKNSDDKSELKRIVKIKNHNGKSTRLVFEKIDFAFDYKIDDDKFNIPDDIKCE